MVADDDFKQHDDRQTAAKRQRDFDDLQNEQAGRDTGRIERFGVSQAQQADIQRKKDEKFRDQLSALERLLRDDPDYASLYQATMDLLTRAERAADLALQNARDDLNAANDALQDIQDRANQLPDGTRIYKDADGNVWTEGGRLLSPDELDGVVWKDDAPSWEDYLDGRKTVDDAWRRIKDIEDYIYNVLGPSRDKMTDPNNPPSKDDVDGIQDDIISKSPKAVAFEQEVLTGDDFEQTLSGSKLDIPKI